MRMLGEFSGKRVFFILFVDNCCVDKLNFVNFERPEADFFFLFGQCVCVFFPFVKRVRLGLNWSHFGVSLEP